MRTISILVIASALCYQARVEPILATFFFHPSTAQAAPETPGKDSQLSRETFHMISGSEGRAEDGTVLSAQLFEGSRPAGWAREQRRHPGDTDAARLDERGATASGAGD